jgi:hypothetical protein
MNKLNVLDFRANLQLSKISLCNEQSVKKTINTDGRREKKSIKLVSKSKK